MKSYAVIGNCVNETVVRQEDGMSRTHLGGTAAIMARMLAGAGAAVTLYTNGSGSESGDGFTLRRMERRGPETGSANITVRRGECVQARGKWPKLPRLAAAEMSDLLDHDWVVLTGAEHQDDAMVICTAARGLSLGVCSERSVGSLAPATRHKGKVQYRVAAMNAAEAGAFMSRHGDAGRSDELRNLLQADELLVTHGAEGWSLLNGANGNVESEAPAPPPGTDFVGAGDSALAGLTLAAAEGLDRRETVNRFIRTLMESNVAGYGHPRRR